MHSAVRAVLALAEIKNALEAFESGDANATETLKRITDACKAVEPPVAKRNAA